MAVNRLFPEPVGSTVWPDKTRGEHFECPAHQAASEWFQTQSLSQFSPKALREMTMEAAMGHDTFPLKQWTSWSDQRVDSNFRIATAPEAHKWLLKPLRLSHGIPATLQHLMHNWSIIPIPMNSHTLNQFYGRVNENCRTRTHSWSSTNIGAHEAVCGFSTEARVNPHLPHSYGPQKQPCRKLISAHTSQSAVVLTVARARREGGRLHTLGGDKIWCFKGVETTGQCLMYSMHLYTRGCMCFMCLCTWVCFCVSKFDTNWFPS